MLGVTEGDTPGGRDAVGEAVRVLLALSVEEGVGASVPVPLAVELCVPEGVGVTGGVALPDWLIEGVCDALAPLVRDAVALVEVVLLALTVLVGVLLPVLVPNAEPTPAPLLLGEGLAPVEREGVGGVAGLPLPLGVGEAEGLPPTVWDGVALPTAELELLAGSVAPGDKLAVGEAVNVVQAEGVEEGVADAGPESLPVTLAEAPRESEGVGDSLAALEEVRASEAGGSEPVALHAAVATSTLALGKRGGVSVREPDGEGVADPLAPGDVIRVSVSEALGEGGGVADGEALGAAAAEPLGVALPVGVTVSVALPVGEPVSEGVALAVALAEPAADAAAEEDAVPLLLVE